MTRPILTISAILTASLPLLGCADKILSDDRIRDSTALALNMPPTSIVISDRQVRWDDEYVLHGVAPGAAFIVAASAGAA